MDFGNDRFLVQVNVKKVFVLLGLGSVRHFLKKELVSHTLPISLLTGTAVSGSLYCWGDDDRKCWGPFSSAMGHVESKKEHFK